METEALQHWHLLVTWWEETNWLYFAPNYPADDMDPHRFTRLVLSNLLSLSEGNPILLRDFVLQLAEQAKSAFPSFHNALKREHREVEDRFIKDLVVIPFSEFGILEPFYTSEDRGDWQREILQSFSITALGLSALESLSRLR